MERREFQQVARHGRTRIWTIEVRGPEIITTYGELGGKMQTVRDVGVRKNVGRANEVSEEEDALYQAGRAILDRVRQGYAEQGTESASSIDWNSTLPINFRFYKPENTLSAALTKKLASGDAWYTRKRDGEMMVLVKGPDGKVDVYSRRMLRSHHLEEGEYVWRDRFGPLVEELERRTDIPPRSILLGDMIYDPKDDGRWEVASFMKSKTPEALKMSPLFFYCWDIAFWDGMDVVSTLPVAERYALIWDTFGALKEVGGAHAIYAWSGDSFVVPIEVWQFCDLLRMGGVPNTTDPVLLGQAVSAAWGWEGWVVVDPTGTYGDKAYNFRGKTDRPGKFCGKLKPAHEDDFVAFFDPDGRSGASYGKWGTGNNRGQVGSVSLYQYNQARKLVYICECGGGISDEFRALYSDPKSYPLVLTVEYTERTFISEGDKTNALTFPRIIAVRTDKEPEECLHLGL